MVAETDSRNSSQESRRFSKLLKVASTLFIVVFFLTYVGSYAIISRWRASQSRAAGFDGYYFSAASPNDVIQSREKEKSHEFWCGVYRPLIVIEEALGGGGPSAIPMKGLSN